MLGGPKRRRRSGRAVVGPAPDVLSGGAGPGGAVPSRRAPVPAPAGLAPGAAPPAGRSRHRRGQPRRQPLPVPVPAGPETATPRDPADDEADETRCLLAGFSRMLATIEQQAADVIGSRAGSTPPTRSSSPPTRSSRSSRSRTTSPGSTTGASSRSGSRKRSRATAGSTIRCRSCCWTWTASRPSTTTSATPPATRRCATWRRSCMRYSRGINVICRYGGDEFTCSWSRRARTAPASTPTASATYSVTPSLRARPPAHRELRHRLAARGRGARRRRPHPRSRRGALRGQARGEEPRLGIRGRAPRPAGRAEAGDVARATAACSSWTTTARSASMLHESSAPAATTCLVAANGREGLEPLRRRAPAAHHHRREHAGDGRPQFLKQARALEPDAAVLVLTGVGDVPTAVEA